MANCMYRLNAKTADCYAFSIIDPISKSKYPLDFEGGYDWSNKLVDTSAEYLYMFDTGEFIKLKQVQ